MKAWTDYPIVELGDTPNKIAPIRPVVVLGWDGNKYARVQLEGLPHLVEIKVGYLYMLPGRLGEVDVINPKELEVIYD